MAGLYDGLEQVAPTPAAAPPPPKTPSMYDGLEVVPDVTSTEPRRAAGVVESFHAGLQASSMGLAWRRKLPDLITAEHENFWQGLASSAGELAGDIGPMIAGAAVGAPTGAAVGAAVTGPAAPVGAIAGGLIGAGAGMGLVPAALRESLTAAYRSGEVTTKAEWWAELRAAAQRVLTETAVSGATFGAVGAAGRVTGRVVAPLIGEMLAVPTQKAGVKAVEAGLASTALSSAELAAAIVAFPTIPALLDARLPDLTEIGHSAIILGGLKGAHLAAERVANVFAKTGKTPAEQVADAQADPKVAAELASEPKAEVPPQAMLSIQEALFRDVARLNELEAPAKVDTLTAAEKTELSDLRGRVADLEGQVKTAQVHDASAQRVYDSVLQQVRDADQARVTAGLAPLGDEHAQAVAALVRARVRTRAERLGMLPEEIYNERPLQIQDVTAKEVVAAEAAIPAGAPTFTPPVDLFGITAPPVPRYAVEGVSTVEVPLAELTLSKDVPQFKAAADEMGVIVPLGGRFDRIGVGPIQVWERTDGRMEVISGRHRLDLARRSGETTIPAQIHREAEGFTVRQAATLDAQLNIREEQGSVADYAQYFKDAGITQEAATELGLLARAKGRSGFAIARDAGPDLLQAHRAGLLSDEAALSISTAAPGIDRLQALGMELVNNGKSILMAVNTMKAVSVMAAERTAAGAQGDIFGFDDSAMREASQMAKLASSQQRQISEQISAVAGASKRPELARRMGVDVQDPEGIQKRVAELRQEQVLWDNWPLHPELVSRLRGVTGREGELKQAPVEDFALQPETPAELEARNREAAAQALRAEEAAGRKRGKALTPEERKAQADLFATQATLFQQHRGSYQVAENLITIMQGADKSTVVHELGHSWLEEMKADAARPGAPESIRADWELLRRELAIPESGDIARASHEQWARSVERYLAEGEAPSAELRSVFQRFKEWLLEIYKSITAFGVDINPELKGALDRMLATDEEIAAARDLGVPRAYVAEAKANEARKIVPGFKAEQVSMEPYADELPKGPGQAPDDSHVNYAYINTPTDVKLTMQKMAEIDQAWIQKQRGGVQGVKSWADANAEQAKYVNDILGGSEDTLRVLSPRDPEAPGPDVKLGILKKLAVGAAKDSARLRDVVLEHGPDATVREQLDYMGSIERARMIQAEFLGERAGVARALNALKDVTEGSGEIARMLDAIGYGDRPTELYQAARTAAEEQAYLKEKLDEILLRYRGKTVLEIAALHKEIGSLKGSYEFARKLEKATTWEMVVEAWRAGLLSGPVTHTTNLFGTGAFQVLRTPVDALASLIGMARGASPGLGESDRASMSEAVAGLTAYLGAVQDGLKVGYHTFLADQTTGKTESYREAIPGRAGEVIRIPLRLMGAEDATVNTMYTRKAIAQLAIRTAFDEDLNPSTREFAERVDFLKDHPTPEMQVAADKEAARMTFNAPYGEKGAALQRWVNTWKLQWMIPFIRTPLNITAELGRMSPFAPLVADWRADFSRGGAARDQALAEFALGSGILALTMAYAFSGNISGAGSPDPGKNRGKAGVWQPYSMLIGDTWYEYGRVQPTGTLIGIAADLANVWDHLTPEEMDKTPKMLAVAFSNAVTNQTFLQGITSFVNATSDPTRFGARFLQQFAGSMVPNVVGQPTAMADPVVREVNSMMEAIQARIPGFRQDLLPKLDWLGAPVETKERLGVVLPVREQPISEDKVRLEAARLDISMAAAPKKTHIGKGTGKLGDIEFTPEERNKFQEVGGQMAHKILTNIVNGESYDALPDLVKKQIFSKVLTASHRVAAFAALPMEKRIAYIQQITEKVAAELAPAGEQ